MKRAVWIDGTRTDLQPAALLGQGGEAEVYDLGDGRVVKWWKPPEHPDFDGLPDAQAAAARRITEAPAKLRALPAGLPSAVVAPAGFALAAKRSGELAGYVMPKIGGTALHAYGEVRWRREHPVDGNDVVAALLALYDALAGLHRARVVVGDCNDLNILVDGRRVHLIDVDSYQFGGFPCSMFSERFVDPRLCDTQLVPVRPHDADSDWFAFAVMALRSLLGVGPWGGVDPRCSPAQRALQRRSVLGAGITYPRAARPLAILPDELLHAFAEIFERDVRGPFPRALLERLRLRRCAACGDEHAQRRCPTCQALAQVPPSIVHGRLRYEVIAPELIAFATHVVPSLAGGRAQVASVLGAVPAPAAPSRSGGPRPAVPGGPTPEARGPSAPPSIWLQGDALYRHTRLGAERVGSVLAGQTRAWVGTKLGVGFYRAGGYAVGFVFRPDRGVLDDRVALPRIRGQLVEAHATLSDDRAWLWLTHSDAGRLVTTAVVIDARGEVLATETLADCAWLAGISGASAAGPHLFVPTDAGVARIEVVQGAITQTRVFAETAPLVGAGDRLALHATGLDVLRRRDAIRMYLT